jgi:hypothetical protein
LTRCAFASATNYCGVQGNVRYRFAHNYLLFALARFHSHPTLQFSNSFCFKFPVWFTRLIRLNSQNGALLHVSDRNDHWLITPKYIEPQTVAPQQTQTWVNVSQARAVICGWQ